MGVSGGAKPVRRSVAFVIAQPAGSPGGRVLIVRRPLDDPDLPGLWGLPAGSLAANETPEDAVRRSGREKLGVELEVTGELNRGRGEREDYTLEMALFGARILAGAPSVPQPFPDVTQYIDWAWGEAKRLRPAAERGSLCSRLFLQGL